LNRPAPQPALPLQANDLLFVRVRQVIHRCKFTPVDWIIAGIMPQCYTPEPRIRFLPAREAHENKRMEIIWIEIG
jgi:hypothetical protein